LGRTTISHKTRTYSTSVSPTKSEERKGGGVLSEKWPSECPREQHQFEFSPSESSLHHTNNIPPKIFPERRLYSAQTKRTMRPSTDRRSYRTEESAFFCTLGAAVIRVSGQWCVYTAHKRVGFAFILRNALVSIFYYDGRAPNSLIRYAVPAVRKGRSHHFRRRCISLRHHLYICYFVRRVLLGTTQRGRHRYGQTDTWSWPYSPINGDIIRYQICSEGGQCF